LKAEQTCLPAGREKRQAELGYCQAKLDAKILPVRLWRKELLLNLNGASGETN